METMKMKDKNHRKVIFVQATKEEWDALGQMLAEQKMASRSSHRSDPACKDDEVIWIRISAHSISDSAGGFYSLAAISNVGERKRIQEKIEIMHTNLASRAYELEMANQELEAFSDRASHDLRLPMTVINGYCQLILETVGDNLGEECKGYIQQIYEETIKASQLMDTLLDFSRLGHSAMQYEAVNLS
ncbi:MAG TPA: histidine kinase dimerization/phospho-acceptor domain-containing protein, partial [Geobacteraceae bacterium]